MPFPVINLEHVNEGLARLIEQYKESPNLRAWISSYLKQVQDLENAIWEVINLRFLPNAFGHQLDVLGKLVGLEREGLSDDLYRGAINLQIRINLSHGTPIDVLVVARLLLGQAYPTIEYSERSPATIILKFIKELMPQERFTLYRGLLDVKAAGVKLFVHEVTNPDNTFTFNDAALTLGNDSAKGWGSVHGATTHGVWSHVACLGSDAAPDPPENNNVEIDGNEFIVIDDDEFVQLV